MKHIEFEKKISYKILTALNKVETRLLEFVVKRKFKPSLFQHFLRKVSTNLQNFNNFEIPSYFSNEI